LIEVELIFMSTASYILHIPEEITCDMPQISQTREVMEQYRRNWKDNGAEFQNRVPKYNQKEK